MGMKWIRRYYGVPAKRGARVTYKGKPGTITRATGEYLFIRLDGKKKSGIYHPTWMIEYLDKSAKVIA